MAAKHAGRRLLSSSSTSTTGSFLSGCGSRSSSSPLFSTATAKSTGGAYTSATSSARCSRSNLPFFSRLPVELGCAQSLMPLHSVTASSLLTSMLSLKARNWGWLSEGFATPL